MRIVFFMLASLLCAPLFAAGAQQQLAASRLVEVARQALVGRLGAEARASLQIIGSPEDVHIAAGAVSLKARSISGHWPRSRVGVPVDVLLDGRVVRSATVWFAVSIQQPALAYGDDAPIGTLAKAVQAASTEIDVAMLQEMPLDNMSVVSNMRLRRPARAGSPVLMSDFEVLPDVDRHERVQVVENHNGVHLAVHGVANEVGNAGDVVAVLVDGTDLPVRARVTDKGVVEVVQ